MSFCSTNRPQEAVSLAARSEWPGVAELGQGLTTGRTIEIWGLRSTKANRRKPKSCMGRVFNLKSGHFAS
jgi:hypothetical protein